MNLLGSKRGQINNYMAGLILLFSFGLIGMISMILMSGFIQGFTDAGFYTGELKETGDNFFNALKLLDIIIVFIMIAVIVGIAVTSYKLAAAPVFFVVSFIMGSFLGFLGYILSYSYKEIVITSEFAAVLPYFPLTTILCTNLHWIGLVLFVVGSITFYAKRPREGGVVE